MAEIYSFYTKDEKETLQEHIVNAIKLINNNSKLIKYGLRLNKEFTKLVYLAIIFHDLGKVFYQKNITTNDYISFKGHEVLSAFIMEEFKQKLLELDIDNFERYDNYSIVTFAILYHHHAMNIKKRVPIVNEESIKAGFQLLSKLKELSEKMKKEGYLNELELKAFIKTIEKISRSNLDNFLTMVIRNIDAQRTKIWQRFVEEKKFRKTALLLVTTLIAVDYLSAQKTRKDTKTIFSQVINDFYELYLKDQENLMQ